MAVHFTQEELEQRIRTELEKRDQRSDINQMMKVEFIGCSAAEQTLELFHPMEDWEINIYHTMHGGLISLLLDANMAIASRAFTGDKATPTLDIHVNFLRPVKQGEPVHTKAWVIRIGRSTVQLRSELWTTDPNRVCATADAIFFRSDPQN